MYILYECMYILTIFHYMHILFVHNITRVLNIMLQQKVVHHDLETAHKTHKTHNAHNSLLSHVTHHTSHSHTSHSSCIIYLRSLGHKRVHLKSTPVHVVVVNILTHVMNHVITPLDTGTTLTIEYMFNAAVPIQKH